jgi:MoaA/NifB/PqqE/SkfB family radical SAM enzyme
VSIYSCRPEVESSLRGVEGTLDSANAAIASLHRAGVSVNVNTVINRVNADHLDETVRILHRAHPYVRHYVWNNLDPSAGNAATSVHPYTARLAAIELSLSRAARYLQRHNVTFRIERVPLCYMTELAWASTETRKIVKQEERVVHFLDEKGTFHQTNFKYAYSASCSACSLRAICAGLFELGNGYDPDELYPVFVDPNEIIQRINGDAADSAT